MRESKKEKLFSGLERCEINGQLHARTGKLGLFCKTLVRSTSMPEAFGVLISTLSSRSAFEEKLALFCGSRPSGCTFDLDDGLSSVSQTVQAP